MNQAWTTEEQNTNKASQSFLHEMKEEDSTLIQ